MSTRLLGNSFDIHGGGSDLTFPHHDNEVAQAKCCSPDQDYARTWMHNGMITVDGQKMSKSLGNFTTVEDLRDSMPGGAIRLGLLTTHYRSSLDWSSDLVSRTLRSWTRFADLAQSSDKEIPAPEEIVAALSDDLNTAEVIAALHRFLRLGDANAMASSLRLLGVSIEDDRATTAQSVTDQIEKVIERRARARADKDFATSDRLRDDLAAAGVQIKDASDGTTWAPSSQIDEGMVLDIDIS
jgi:cysteinyl-tRNA synthetase